VIRAARINNVNIYGIDYPADIKIEGLRDGVEALALDVKDDNRQIF